MEDPHYLNLSPTKGGNTERIFATAHLSFVYVMWLYLYVSRTSPTSALNADKTLPFSLYLLQYQAAIQQFNTYHITMYVGTSIATCKTASQLAHES